MAELPIVADGDQSGHVERPAQTAAAASDPRLALPFARLAGDRSEPGEAGGLFAIAPSSGISTIIAIAATGPMPGMDTSIPKWWARPGSSRDQAEKCGVDPHAWLADTLASIPDYKITKVDELLPWRTRP